MSEFVVVAGTSPAYTFVGPHRILRSGTPAESARVFDEAQAALDAGYWIAGYVTYERSVRLGVFDPPDESALPLVTQGFQMSPLQGGTTRADYDNALARIHTAIYEGDVYQVNYTVPFEFSFTGDPFDAYRRFAKASGSNYCGYIRDGDRAILSFSPELFLGFENNRLTTKPMKGTAPLDRAEELGSEKNRAEHLMIVDLLRNDLYRIGCEVEVERLFEFERYPTFATMTSTIHATRTPLPPLRNIFEAAFPCGSITGTPKVAAIQCIASLESQSREAYCGTIGFLSPERKGWWNVAIRTAQLDCARGIGRYDAGGGIVSDSEPSSEWAEVHLKTRFFQEIAEPFEILETFRLRALGLHLERLRKTAEHFNVPYDERALRDTLALFSDHDLIRLRVKNDGSITCRAEQATAPERAVQICVSDVVVQSQDPMLRWKTSWRPAYTRASAQAHEHACFDALLQNERGEITEGARTNVFIQIEGVLYTPPMHCGLLPGILREQLLASGRAVERILRIDDIRNAEQLFIGNSARGLLQATLFETLTSPK